MAVKILNDYVGTHGLVLTLLFYGTLPRLLLRSDSSQSNILTRTSAVRRATEELSQRFAKYYVKAALFSSHTPNAEPIHKSCIGHQCLCTALI